MFSQENMTTSVAPATSVPSFGQLTASGQVKVYPPDTSKQWRVGLMSMAFSLLGLLPLRDVSHWLAGGPVPTGRTFFAAALLLLFPFGLLSILGALRGLPRLTIVPQGVQFDTVFKTLWAKWDSLEPFAVKIRHVGRFNNKAVRTASAQVAGANVSKNLLRSKIFLLTDSFAQPIDTVVADLNAARAQATGIAVAPPSATVVREEAAVSLFRGQAPWLTLSLLAVLVGIFILENQFSPMPNAGLSPITLFSMGALNRTAVLSGGEWYRLLTAPLLHANFAHIAGNGIALVFGGVLLERLVGRLWYFAFFTVGALGGSLMSLAVGPPNLTSVGASGALMGLFAALLVSSFHLPAHTPGRTALQFNSLRILIPSLLPLASSGSVAHIDYGAHFGGAIGGALLAALVLKFWPQGERLPQLRNVAAAISAIGGILFLTSAAAAISNYPKYSVTMIPQAEVPHTMADLQARAATLVERYPNDPRSHLYLGQTLAAAKDNAGAERELRLALADAQKYSMLFGSQLELAMRGVLGTFLAEEGKKDEAKDVVRPVCSAPAGDQHLANILKLLAAQHLCD
jgi:rhomboid protease GluP